MSFYDNLKDYMILNDVKIQDISKATDIEDSVLYDYAKGSIPNIEHAVKLANYMNCTLNYLMGIDEEPNNSKFKSNYDISVFSNRYDNLLKENNIAHYRLCKEKGLNYSSHYAWQHGAKPSMTSLIIIAQYFDVSIDYLVGRSDSK